MAVLEKIRVKLGVLITVLIAVALLAFIVDPTTLESTIRVFSSKYDAGKIDGQSIRAEDFQAKVDEYTKVYSIISGKQSPDEQALEYVRNSAWQDMVNDLFVIPQIEKAGVFVGEEELHALTVGSVPSPIISQSAAFMDESGQFSQERFHQFLAAVDADESGSLSMYWNFLVKSIRTQQYLMKYTSLLSASNVLNPVELRREVEENNVSASVDFVMVPVGYGMDSTIQISDSEVKEYYNKHIDRYHQEASRDIEFVAYEAVPSQEDVDAAREAAEKVFEEFSTTDNLKVFLARNSDLPLSNVYFSKEQLESQFPEMAEFAFSAKPDVLPIFQKDDSFMAARVNDTKVMSDSAFVMHILLSPQNEAKADSLLKVAGGKGADFSQLAHDWSVDTNPNVEHTGDLGWLTQQMMLPGLEDVLTMAPNTVAKMKTQYGTHIVKVTQRTTPVKKVQLAVLCKNVSVSNETVKGYYAQANSLAAKCEGKIANFDKVVAEENLPVVPVNGLSEGARKISKFDNVREVSRWVYDAKEGDVSQIITVDNRVFFVVALKSINKEGNIPMEKVAPSIKFTLNIEKRLDKLSAEVADKIKGASTMDEVAQALDASVSHNDAVVFGSVTAQSFDPKLVGAIASAEQGKITGPVKGLMGVYVFDVNSRETGSFYTEDDAKQKAARIQSAQLNVLMSIFNKMADIKDNRARFF